MPMAFRSPLFACALRCGRCTAKTTGGLRCRNRVCLGAPVCWQHTRRDKGLRLAKSTIPGAGRGVFALGRSFRAGEIVCTYEGERMSKAQVDRRYPGDVTAPYTLCSPGGRCMDGACRRGVGSMLNGVMDGSHNVVFDWHKGRPVVRATRAIRDGDELLADYGPDYRFDMRHSTRY